MRLYGGCSRVPELGSRNLHFHWLTPFFHSLALLRMRASFSRGIRTVVRQTPKAANDHSLHRDGSTKSFEHDPTKILKSVTNGEAINSRISLRT